MLHSFTAQRECFYIEFYKQFLKTHMVVIASALLTRPLCLLSRFLLAV